MDTSRNDQLGELAADAALERSDFLVQASAQLRKFLDANANRISDLGGLVLIDDEVDYLAVAADLSFRSRNRYLDAATGKWVSETEIIENPSELVELYNPADIFAAFADAKSDAGAEEEPVAEGGPSETAEIAPGNEIGVGGENPYAAAADDWAASARVYEDAPDGEEEAAARLYDLALAFQERSQQTEAHLLEQFETAAASLASVLGDLIIVDDVDERLTLRASGTFAAEVVPEDEAESGTWRKLDGPDDIVEFYDPTDVFGDLADALAEAFPSLAGPDGEAGGPARSSRPSGHGRTGRPGTRWRALARGTTGSTGRAESACFRPAQPRRGASSPAVVALLARDVFHVLDVLLASFGRVSFFDLSGFTIGPGQAREGLGQSVRQVAEDIGRVVELHDVVRTVELAPGSGLGLVLGHDLSRECPRGAKRQPLVHVIDDDEVAEDGGK